MVEISANSNFGVVEISILSQNLFSHIQNQFPIIFCNHHSSILTPNWEIFYEGKPPECRVQYIVIFQICFIY